MSPKQKETGGGQKCPLRREELEGTKLSPKQGRKRGGQKCPLNRERQKCFRKRRYKVGRYKGRSYFDARFL